MGTERSTNTFAGRVGTWSARHWKTAVLLWVLFVVGVSIAGSLTGSRVLGPEDQNIGEARRADHMLVDGGLRTNPQEEYVLVRSDRMTVDDPAFRAVIADVLRSVEPFAASYGRLRSPYRASGQVSGDHHAAYVGFAMKGDSDVAKSRIDPILTAVERVQDRHPAFFVGQAGAASTGKAFDRLVKRQLEQAGTRSLPLTLLVLLLVFGSVIAAVLPVGLALTGVVGALGMVAVASRVVPSDQNVSVVVLLIGLAVGVDYSLFYLKRRREERAKGRSSDEALRIAAATSGRTVLISGLTVLIAMAGMLFTGDKTFMSFGIGTMAVVATAVVGSLTVLPALLGRLGDTTDRGRIPFVSRRLARREDSVWAHVAAAVMRRPRLSAAVSSGLLIALAIPATQLHTAQSGLDAIPADTPEVRALTALEHSFPGGSDPARIVVKAPDIDAPNVTAAIGELQRLAVARDVTTRPAVVSKNTSTDVAQLEMALVGEGTDERSDRALATLRTELLPSTLGEIPNVEYAVGGLTAASHDSNQSMKEALPLVVGFVLSFAFVLLLASFRSIVIAATAVALNMLSVAAAYGVLVMVFQADWAESLLGFTSNGGIAPWMPLFLFVILFGLSMDYHVFILSRIREGHDRGASTDEAIITGIGSTAGVVTSAAIVMVGAFALFATLPIRDLKEMGVGLAVAVLLDATVVRGVLLPSVMKLLGEHNWYLPSWLGWLPQVGRGRRTGPTPAHRGVV